MAKPKIIIVDSDLRYIVSLELQMVKDLKGDFDLFVMDNEEFFANFFSMPQSADILVIAEQMYSEDLLKHNIKNVYVLTEDSSKDSFAEGRVKYIYRYTSASATLDRIGRTSKAFEDGTNKGGKAKIILAYSANGGAGKTTVAVGVGGALTRNNKRVLYVDGTCMQASKFILTDKTPITDIKAYGALGAGDGADVYDAIKKTLRQEVFSYVPPLKAPLVSMGVSVGNYKNLVCGAAESGDFDYIVVDTDSAFDTERAALMDLADVVLVVSNGTTVSNIATNIFMENVNISAQGKFLIICNKWDEGLGKTYEEPGTEVLFPISEKILKMDATSAKNIRELARNIHMQKIAVLIS